MKKMLFMMACVLLAGIGLQSCKSNDQKIKDEIQKVIGTNYNTVNANVKDGVVTLTGTVDSQQTRSAAETAARSVKNVKSVVNNIMVNNSSSTTNSVAADDAAMRATITSRLSAAGFQSVKVEVNNGEVTLTGDLNRTDLTRVMQIANESSPRRVINNMNLK